MTHIGFNIPFINELGDGWQTKGAPPRPPKRKENFERVKSKPVASSIRRQIAQKETESVVFTRRFVVSESLDHSRLWFQREVEAQLKRGGLFEDPFMPPVDSTIWPDSSSSSSRYHWRRPGVSFFLIKFHQTLFYFGIFDSILFTLVCVLVFKIIPFLNAGDCE